MQSLGFLNHGRARSGFAVATLRFSPESVGQVVQLVLIQFGVSQQLPGTVAQRNLPGLADGRIVLPIERMGPRDGLARQEGRRLAPSSGRCSDGAMPTMAQIVGTNRRCTPAHHRPTCWYLSGPADDAWHAIAGFRDVQLHAAERPRAPGAAIRRLVSIQCFRAVVTAEEDKRVVAEPAIVQKVRVSQ